jgi:hypothetical protein
MTLWPISMLSRIFDSESAAVPSSHDARERRSSSARPPTSSARCALITR